MKKNIIKITESQLHKIIKESVEKAIDGDFEAPTPHYSEMAKDRNRDSQLMFKEMVIPAIVETVNKIHEEMPTVSLNSLMSMLMTTIDKMARDPERYGINF